jgi:hypothetical protein
MAYTRASREAYLLRGLAMGVPEKELELGDGKRLPRPRPHVGRCHGARDGQGGGGGEYGESQYGCTPSCHGDKNGCKPAGRR